MPSINFNHFYYFYEVARHGSFTAAARELMISQSALSIQIKAFEEDLGRPLFDRRRGGVDLTEAGNRAFVVAERAFRNIDTMLADIKESERQFSGTVSVGTVNSVGEYLLPPVLRQFREKFDDIKVRIEFKDGEGVMDMLHAGKIDFALVPWNRTYRDLKAILLEKNKMFLVAPPDHPLAREAKAVSPRDLGAHPFVGYREGLYTRAMMDSLLKRMSVTVDYVVESSNSITMKHMVMAGMGLGILPDLAVAAELRSGKLVRLEIPTLIMAQEIMLYFRKTRTLSPVRAEFVQFLTEYFTSRVSHRHAGPR